MDESGVPIANLSRELLGDTMYESPKLERFGTLRQIVMAPFASLGMSRMLAAGSLPVGVGNCGPNVPVGDPSACSRS
jgi:hypothetical protein